MRLLSVIPLAGGGKETLTYFSGKDIPAGALVKVPLRKKSVHALVLTSEDASTAKTDVKNADYSMKKVESVVADVFFLPQFMAAAQKTARHFATTTGAVLEALTPSGLLEHAGRLPEPHIPDKPLRDDELPNDIVIFQSSDEERFATYKSIIREEFARGRSVFFCLPTIADIERATRTLERGIQEYTYILHSDLGTKALRERWGAVVKEEHPVLIIATGTFLSIPRHDLKTLIVEEESNYAYKLPYRPFVDIRTFAEIYARELGARLVYGDTFLRVETLARKDDHKVSEMVPLKFRALSNAEQSLIDMTAIKDEGGNRVFQVIADELLARIKLSEETAGHFFFLTARRGLYPLTVCDDCSSIVTCRRCAAPLVVHKTPEYAQRIETENMFVCHRCSDTRAADDRCRVCGGARFSLLGIGSEHVEERLSELFPHVPIFRLDKDTAPNRKRALEIRDSFYDAPRSILVGTSMALGYLDRKVDHTAVVSVDSLFTIPDFHINERVFNLLLRTRDLALTSFTIQSRMASHLIFEYVLRGNLLGFYRSEIDERKQFSYPPFKILIKISYADTEHRALEAMARMKEHLADYDPIIFPAFAARVKGRHVMNVILKIDTGNWPEEKLLAKLYALPPSYAIAVDPDTIL